MATKRRMRKPRERILAEGNSEMLTVHTFMGDVSATLSRKVLRYLKVRSGDKLQIVARNGVVEVSPILSVEEEIKNYVSH
jgi:hypothetical protein